MNDDDWIERWKEKVVQPPTPTHEELLALDAEVAQHPQHQLCNRHQLYHRHQYPRNQHQLHQHGLHQHHHYHHTNQNEHQLFGTDFFIGGGEPENQDPHPGFKSDQTFTKYLLLSRTR